MNDVMVRVAAVSKQYKLGQIGGTTLKEELQRMKARRQHKEDPTKKIGEKSYAKGETFMALNGISFDVKKGERVGIIGHNGAGKSTLLKLLSRITAPTAGEIGLNGRVASMLEVGTGFNGELTGRENIYMNGAILGMKKREIDKKIEDIIEFSECRQFIDTPVKRYSSGMYVKLAFSVAAHLDSEIMIMDEVLAVGDMAFQKKCLEKMAQVSMENDRTILYVSHNMNTIRELCDRVIVLSHGTIIFDGGVEEGISIYMERAQSEPEVNIDLDQCKHLQNQSNDGLTMRRLLLTDKVQPIYSDEEDIKLVLTVDATREIKDSYFLLSINCGNGYVAGTTCSAWNRKINLPAHKGTEIEFTFPAGHLAPGKYLVGISYYELNSANGRIMLDGVKNAFEFSIFQKPEKGKRILNQNSSGAAIFPDMQYKILNG